MTPKSIRKALRSEQAEWGEYKNAHPTTEQLQHVCDVVAKLEPEVSIIHQRLHDCISPLQRAFEFAHWAFIVTAYHNDESLKQAFAQQLRNSSVEDIELPVLQCLQRGMARYRRSRNNGYHFPELFAMFFQCFSQEEVREAFNASRFDTETYHELEAAWEECLCYKVNPLVQRYVETCTQAQRDLRPFFEKLKSSYDSVDADTGDFLDFHLRLHFYFDREPYRSRADRAKEHLLAVDKCV